MPVRVYDIAMKLGLENKDILVKAKELGIAAAKVPSSSLDKVTAEWLEEEVIKSNPAVAGRLAPIPVEGKPKTEVSEEPTVVIHAPRPSPPAPQPKPQIILTVTGHEFVRLIEQIKAGEVEFRLNIEESGYEDGLRICFVRDEDAKPGEAKVKSEYTRAEIDGRTKDLLRAAYYVSRHRSIDGWLNLADYGSAIKKQDPTFQPQKFGERSLGSLLRRVDFFELRNDESNPIVYYLRMKDEQTPAKTLASTAKIGVPPAGKVARGKIHNLRLGFGFIMPDDGSENAFFHATDIEGCTIYDLKPGDAVEYEPGFNEKGPCARKIRRIAKGPALEM